MVKSFTCKLLLILLLSRLAFPFLSEARSELLHLKMGGKSTSDLYFPSTTTIADSVNRKNIQNDVKITIRSTRDSASVIEDVVSGRINFGVARLIHIYQAYNGLAQWKGRPRTYLRCVFNVYGEQIALFASVKSGIRTIQDVKGHRVFIGVPRSDLHHSVSDILAAVEINPSIDFTVAGEVIDDAVDMMAEDEIDAFFIILGFVNRTFIELLSGTKKIRLVPIDGAEIDQMIAGNPFYGKAMIGPQDYPYLANQLGAQVLHVRAGLITTERTWDKTVYQVVGAVFDYKKIFKSLYPNGKILTDEKMTESLLAPLHRGAVNYYQQFEIPYDFNKP